MYGPTISQRSQLLIRVSAKQLSLIFVLSLLAVPPNVGAQSNAASPPSAATAVAPIADLELAKPIEREITGGQVHVYNLTLKVDEYAEIDVDQRGIDLAVWTFDPTG